MQRVRAYDSSDIAKGTLFEVPVTVVQPAKLDIRQSNIFTYPMANYKPNTINRNFICVPNKATWAIVKLRSPNTLPDIPAKFWVHTMQVLPQRYCKALETQKILSVSCENFATHAFKCKVSSFFILLNTNQPVRNKSVKSIV